MNPLEHNDEPRMHNLGEKLRELILGNRKANLLIDFLEADDEVQSLICHGNTLVVGRLNYNDHGPTHSILTAINSLTILELLQKRDITPTVEIEHWGDFHDAQVIVLGGSYLHDIGNSVHRYNHHTLSPFIAQPILRRGLENIYSGKKKHRIRASMLECIYSHDEIVDCLRVEAGCVTVGDGADMAYGRARVPFSRGKTDIHAVSALAIKAVRIVEGKRKPVRIEVDMTESAGIFQLQEVLGKKIETSGLQKYIEIAGKIPTVNGNIMKDIKT